MIAASASWRNAIRRHPLTRARRPAPERRAAERDAGEVDAEDRGERVDGAAEHEPIEPEPRDLERKRHEAAQREHRRERAPVLASGQLGGARPGDRRHCARGRRARSPVGPGVARHARIGCEPRPERRRQVEHGRDERGPAESECGHEQEASAERAEDGAQRVDGIEPRKPRAHRAALAARHQHRERGPHERRRHEQDREQEPAASESEREALAAQRAVELAHRPIERAQQRQHREARHRHPRLEQRVAPARRAAARERGAEEARAERQAGEERSHDDRRRAHRAPEQVGELLAPHHLVEEPRRAGGDQAARGPARNGGRPANVDDVGCASARGERRCRHGAAV